MKIIRKNKAAQDLVAMRNKKLTPERRSEIASKAVQARWAKQKASEVLSHSETKPPGSKTGIE